MLGQDIGRRNSMIRKGGQTRFNLLLLEDGEFYLEDYSVYRYPDPSYHSITFEESKKRKIQGRLKVCTRSFFFEPQDWNQPIIRFRFRSMIERPFAEIFEAKSCDDYLSISIKDFYYMKEKGIDHPYVQKVASKDNIPQKFIFSLNHSKLSNFLDLIEPLWVLAYEDKVLNKIDEEERLQPVLSARHTNQFDTSLLVDFRERPLLSPGKLVNRIVPLLKYPGCLMLTTQRVYFQPAQVNNVGDPVLNFEYSSISRLYKRRHMMRQCGLECFLHDGSSYFFSFEHRKDRDEIDDIIRQQKDMKNIVESTLENTLRKWQSGEISNFDYLIQLNNEAGRTKNDLTQYPVFPWVISDYESDNLDLKTSSSYRDLSKPMGALNTERLEYFRQRFNSMPRGMEHEGLPPPFLYGTHYSTPGYVLFYLVRQAPEYMLCLQNGKFDSADRLFKSIGETYKSCLTNHADLKELIPSFYDVQSKLSCEWLENRYNLDLGATQQGQRVNAVELPPWAADTEDFVKKNREALESEYVSEHLHEWIDLIFGYKQKGEEAIESDNLFYYLSYEGSVDLESVSDPVQKCSLEAQIQEFGQTPKQLFISPHPSRNDAGKSVKLAPHIHLNTETEPIEVNQQDGEIVTPSDIKIQETISVERKRRFNFSRPSLPNSLKGKLGSSDIPNSLKGKFSTGLSSTADRVRRVSFRRKSNQKFWNWPSFTQDDWTISSCYSIHRGSVSSLHFTRDNRAVFSSSLDTTMKITSLEDGVARRSLPCHVSLTSCEITQDEKFALLGGRDNHIYLYSIDRGRAIDKLEAHDKEVTCVRISDDRLLSASLDCSVKLWQHSPSGMRPSPIRSFNDCESPVSSLGLGPKAMYAAAGTVNGIVHLYDLRCPTIINKVNVNSDSQTVSDVVFSSDGFSIVSASINNVVSIHSMDGTQVASYNADINANLTCMTTDGHAAVTGYDDGVVRFWRLDQSPDTDQSMPIDATLGNGISALAVDWSGSNVAVGTKEGDICALSLNTVGYR